ncbi:MAG: PA2779 family protein [Elusimicrobia bacterium]|nr:PA2779 family protein [Elusimicrobiota bacterium]
MTKQPGLSGGARALACLLIFTTTMVCTLQTGARAMLAPATAPASDTGSQRAADVKTVQKTLESKVLRRRLHELGLSDKEIQARLDKLSDRQVHQFASRLHALNPAGDFTLIGVLIVVVLVLFIIYLVKRA